MKFRDRDVIGAQQFILRGIGTSGIDVLVEKRRVGHAESIAGQGANAKEKRKKAEKIETIHRPKFSQIEQAQCSTSQKLVKNAELLNFFARIKRFRRVNTRYDSLVCTYMSFLALASLADCIRF